jgi:hypothetical protein
MAQQCTDLTNVNRCLSKCPGVYFAEDSAFIFITSMLSVFTFSKKADADGKEIEPVIECGPSALSL